MQCCFCKNMYCTKQLWIIQGHMAPQGHIVNTLEGLPMGGRTTQWGWKIRAKILKFKKRERGLLDQETPVSHRLRNMIILNLIQPRAKEENKSSRRGWYLARLGRKPTSKLGGKLEASALSLGSPFFLVPNTNSGWGYLVFATPCSSCLRQREDRWRPLTRSSVHWNTDHEIRGKCR